MWWSRVEDFERDAERATAEQLMAMKEWASEDEDSADRPGMGRNPKARRLFRRMRQVADDRLVALDHTSSG